jgi:hypothetical protein
LAGGYTLEVPCRTGLTAVTSKAAHLGSVLRESDVRQGEAVPVITGGPTLAVATTLIIPNLILEMGKVLSAVTAAPGKGHKDVDPRHLANGQSTTVPARAQWSSCPHPAEMWRCAFTPAGSRKCGGKSWSNIGRKKTTVTPTYLPPRGVCCRGAGMVVSLRMGMLAVGSL